MDYVLTTDRLQKRYGHYTALNGVFMHIPAGSIYGFTGRNGAGKTTLIRLICGLQAPTAGSYTLFGYNSTQKEIKKSRRRIGVLMDTPSLYLNMTVVDNLKVQYRTLGLPSYDDIPQLLRFVALEDTGRKPVRNLSLGMRQRLGIAMALAGNPDLLILDEPFNGLDPQGIVEVRELLLKLNREHQVTILITSHILEELSRLATCYGFIDKGCILKEIDAGELENSLRKSLDITVSSIQPLCTVLEEKGVEYRVVSETEAKIYGQIGITELVQALAERECMVLSLREHEEGLENYYMNLVGLAKGGEIERIGI